jgi:MoaA/NifB/PqqE/SkfB family radical SAM enzyme
MRYHSFESVEEIHVEITNKCNASCPMCARNEFGGKEREGLSLTQWEPEDAKIVFDPRFSKLRNILFCGTHGDPAAAKDALEIVQIARQNTSATIEFYSNASLRSSSWWFDLGKTMSFRRDDQHYRKSDLGIFSVDGLSDTNHLYRRNTNFDKIIENASAFINGGGRARWDFIVFKHNEHQVDEAEKLASKLGFSQFRVRKTSRFAYSPDGPNKHRVQNKNGEIAYYLEPPTNPAYLNPNKEKFEAVVKGAQERKDEEIKINCLNKSQFQRIYINAFMEVFPCCFLSSDYYTHRMNIAKKRDIQEKVFDVYEKNFNSLRLNPWAQIFDQSWLSNDLVSSWSDGEKRLTRCVKTCGSDFSPIISQSEDRIVSN